MGECEECDAKDTIIEDQAAELKKANARIKELEGLLGS